MTIKELRAKVVAELRGREAGRDELAGVEPGASEDEAIRAWGDFYKTASNPYLDAADEMKGEIEALRWVIDLIDRGSRRPRPPRSSRPKLSTARARSSA